MTPDQISALTAIAAVISKMGEWPLGSLIAAIVFGPWIIMGFVSWSMSKRHEAAMQMYENNVELVKSYQRIAEEQADTIRLSTSATVELTTYLKSKTPCHHRISDMLGRPR